MINDQAKHASESIQANLESNTDISFTDGAKQTDLQKTEGTTHTHTHTVSVCTPS